VSIFNQLKNLRPQSQACWHFNHIFVLPRFTYSIRRLLWVRYVPVSEDQLNISSSLNPVLSLQVQERRHTSHPLDQCIDIIDSWSRLFGPQPQFLNLSFQLVKLGQELLYLALIVSQTFIMRVLPQRSPISSSTCNFPPSSRSIVSSVPQFGLLELLLHFYVAY